MIEHILDQSDFPKLPEKGKRVKISGTKLKDPSLEKALSVIVETCVQMGEWAQFPAADMDSAIKKRTDSHHDVEKIVDSLWKLHEKGLITMAPESPRSNVFRITPNPLLKQYIHNNNISVE